MTTKDILQYMNSEIITEQRNMSEKMMDQGGVLEHDLSLQGA